MSHIDADKLRKYNKL